MEFKSLHIIEPILKSLHEEGYRTPTPIQSQAIPLVLKGHDLLGVAQTGTGKTAAFAIPILQILSEQKANGREKKYQPSRKGIRCLILTPTRELAIQIDDSFKAYGRFLKLRTAVIFGGVSQGSQTNALRKGVDIVVATPGRLLDLMDQGHVHLEAIEMFVLDEADRMLDMGFVRDVQKIIEELPGNRQSLFFSATMPPAIVKLSNDILYEPIKIEVTPVSSTVDLIEQSLFFVEKGKKLALLMHVLEDLNMPTTLVFTRTKHGADNVVRTLNRNNIKAEAIHGNKAQNARQRALQNFKSGRTQVLVATDIAARGIDIDELEYVVNFEIPNVPETYVHRIGRTGRAGSAGIALSFASPDEKAYVKDVEKLIKKKIPVVYDHPFAKADAPHDRDADNRPAGASQGRRSRGRSYSEDSERKRRAGGQGSPGRGSRENSRAHSARSERPHAPAEKREHKPAGQHSDRRTPAAPHGRTGKPEGGRPARSESSRPAKPDTNRSGRSEAGPRPKKKIQYGKGRRKPAR